MTRIRAAVCRDHAAPLSIEEIDLAPPTGRSVEVTLEACAICHSDISYADGSWGGTLPAVYGHEAAGRVSALGPGAIGVSLGDPVIVTLIRACGTCPSCGTGHPATCSNPSGPSPLTLADGTPCHQGMYTAAFAEKVVVDQSQIARIPEGLGFEAASLLSCGVITGIGAVVNSGALRPGEDAVVIGAGGVGLNAIQGARLAGARRVVAVDMTESKLEDARDLGATDTLLATTEAPWDQLEKLIGKKAEAVFVTVGSAPVYTSAPNYLARGGRLVMVGMPATGALSDYEPDMIASLGQSMIGSKMGDAVLSRDIPWLADLYLQGRIKLDELISGRWTLDQINEAIADTRAGRARRNVIVF